MNGLEEFKRLAYENACCRCQYHENGKCQNKGECVWSNIEKELMLFRLLLKIALSDESDREFIQNATEEDIRESYRNDELPKKEELSADDWVKLFGIAKEALK